MSLYYCANCARGMAVGDVAMAVDRFRPLTRRQFAIYHFLARYVQRHGYAPSFEEIAEQFDYNSLATVHEHLQNLQRKGWIARRFNESRAIECLVSLDELPVGSGVTGQEERA